MNEDFHPETFFEDVIGVTKHARLSKATVRFKADTRQASYILTKPLHASQVLIEQCKDGSMVFEITVVLNPELYAVLMGFGPGVKVLSPKQAVEEMRKMYREGAETTGSRIGNSCNFPKRKNHPMKGFVQVLQVLLFFVATIIAVSILIDKSPATFLPDWALRRLC